MILSVLVLANNRMGAQPSTTGPPIRDPLLISIHRMRDEGRGTREGGGKKEEDEKEEGGVGKEE